MRLDVVIPAHNEEDRIDRTLRVYRSMLGDHDVRLRVALDHCTDRTAEVTSRHAAEDDRVLVYEYPKLGKGGVVMETLRRCDAELVGFVDADCSTPPAEFLRLVEAVEHDGVDVAIASRSHPSAVVPNQRPRSRRVTSQVFRMLVRRLFHLPFHDTQCGAKVARRSAMDSMLPLLSSRDFLFDVDLLVAADRMGFEVAEVPTIWIDQAGSKLHPVADAARMAGSSLRLWIHHRLLPFPPAPQPVSAVSAASAERAGPAAPVIDLRDPVDVVGRG
jgi:glycosyltransferase involved in cell wall biosynthesis